MVRIHINRHVVAANRKSGSAEPPISVVRSGRRVERCAEVAIIGPARLIYRPDKPLRCGATIWIEAVDAVPSLSPP